MSAPLRLPWLHQAAHIYSRTVVQAPTGVYNPRSPMGLTYKPSRGTWRRIWYLCPIQAALATPGSTHLLWDCCTSPHWSIEPRIVHGPDRQALQRDMAADLKRLPHSSCPGYPRQHTSLKGLLYKPPQEYRTPDCPWASTTSPPQGHGGEFETSAPFRLPWLPQAAHISYRTVVQAPTGV